MLPGGQAKGVPPRKLAPVLRDRHLIFPPATIPDTLAFVTACGGPVFLRAHPLLLGHLPSQLL
jgi:hypothetical protein